MANENNFTYRVCGGIENASQHGFSAFVDGNTFGIDLYQPAHKGRRQVTRTILFSESERSIFCQAVNSVLEQGIGVLFMPEITIRMQKFLKNPSSPQEGDLVNISVEDDFWGKLLSVSGEPGIFATIYGAANQK